MTDRLCAFCNYRILTHDLVLYNGQPHHIGCLQPSMAKKDKSMNAIQDCILAEQADEET